MSIDIEIHDSSVETSQSLPFTVPNAKCVLVCVSFEMQIKSSDEWKCYLLLCKMVTSNDTLAHYQHELNNTNNSNIKI